MAQMHIAGIDIKNSVISLLHKIRLGLAIVPLCHGTGARPFDEHRRPLAPSKFFDVRYGEKFYYRCGPLPTPLVVMITKLSLIGIPSKNSISL